MSYGGVWGHFLWNMSTSSQFGLRRCKTCYDICLGVPGYDICSLQIHHLDVVHFCTGCHDLHYISYFLLFFILYFLLLYSVFYISKAAKLIKMWNFLRKSVKYKFCIEILNTVLPILVTKLTDQQEMERMIENIYFHPGERRSRWWCGNGDGDGVVHRLAGDENEWEYQILI